MKKLLLNPFLFALQGIILCSLTACVLTGHDGSEKQKFTNLCEIELLRDPVLAQGITQGYANHLTLAERKDCLSRWENKGITNARWAFWEISEKLYFAHNPKTPVLPNPGEFVWSTADKTKQFRIANGDVRMIFDSGKEWREGGKLNLPEKDGTLPKYGNPYTTWPHFLIGQHFAQDNNPSTVIQDKDKVCPGKYNRLRFNIDIKLNRLLKSSKWDHSKDFIASNHAVFYIAFVVMPTSASQIQDLGKLYILVPAIYSEGDNKHVPNSAPWIGLDQFGDGVYFSGSYPVLRAGAWVHYDIDVKQLIREGLGAAAHKSLSEGKTRLYKPKDYFLACILIGWETWGGFDTDLEFRNLSLKGTQ